MAFGGWLETLKREVGISTRTREWCYPYGQTNVKELDQAPTSLLFRILS